MYQTRTVILLGEVQRNTAQALLNNAPNGIEIVFREPVKQRSREANSFAWAGVLKDFAEQGWVRGKQYSQKVWHELLKEKFLPDTPEDGYTLEGYVKWLDLPNGRRSMVGSTTELTVKGFARYLEEVQAFGAGELGIRFTAKG